MFHAGTGQTLTRTSQRHDSRSAAIDGSKLNLCESITLTINTQQISDKQKKNLRPDALLVGGYDVTLSGLLISCGRIHVSSLSDP